MTAREVVTTALAQCGISVNGKQPWDITVHNPRFFDRLLAEGSLGAGESYMDGWWDCQKLDELTARIFRKNVVDSLKTFAGLKAVLKAKLLNAQRKSRAFNIGEKHYDRGNDMYQIMLGPSMTYSCGYWKRAKTLAQAQRDKHKIVCDKLGIKKGMRVLDIGCGWGGFAYFAAKERGAHVHGITVSKEQHAHAARICKGLPITIELRDYRDLTGSYDRIVSIGMFEHVGYKNYRVFMQTVRRLLKDDGLCLLHTIGNNASSVCGDAWMEKYIFPGGMLPSIEQVGKASANLLVMEDWHNFGIDYHKTLLAWCANFEKAWPKIREQYGDRFYRMWRFYLLGFAGAFKARTAHLWQIVLSKNGLSTGYNRVS